MVISELKQHNRGIFIKLGPRNKYCNISELAFNFLNNDDDDDDDDISILIFIKFLA
jgi:hypothetical protein